MLIVSDVLAAWMKVYEIEKKMHFFSLLVYRQRCSIHTDNDELIFPWYFISIIL